jgi:hypothetical protein
MGTQFPIQSRNIIDSPLVLIQLITPTYDPIHSSCEVTKDDLIECFPGDSLCISLVYHVQARDILTPIYFLINIYFPSKNLCLSYYDNSFEMNKLLRSFFKNNFKTQVKVSIKMVNFSHKHFL